MNAQNMQSFLGQIGCNRQRGGRVSSHCLVALSQPSWGKSERVVSTIHISFRDTHPSNQQVCRRRQQARIRAFLAADSYLHLRLLMMRKKPSTRPQGTDKCSLSSASWRQDAVVTPASSSCCSRLSCTGPQITPVIPAFLTRLGSNTGTRRVWGPKSHQQE